MTPIDDLIKRLREDRIVPIPVGETLVINLRIEPSSTDIESADALERLKAALEIIADTPDVRADESAGVARRALYGEG